MRILAIDTTTAAGSVAVLEAEANSVQVKGVVSTLSDEAYSSRLFRQLEFLLSELRLSTGDFDLFAVAAGPGTFTGLRVGLTAAKGWAEVHGRPVAAVSTLEAIACQAQNCTPPSMDDVTLPSRYIVPVTDARRGQVYGGIYECAGSSLRRVADDVVMPPAEFWPYLKESCNAEDFNFATPGVPFLKLLIADSPFASNLVVGVSSILAPALGEVGWRNALRGKTCDALTLDAHYIRRSDAEMLFKG